MNLNSKVTLQDIKTAGFVGERHSYRPTHAFTLGEMSLDPATIGIKLHDDECTILDLLYAAFVAGKDEGKYEACETIRKALA